MANGLHSTGELRLFEANDPYHVVLRAPWSLYVYPQRTYSVVNMGIPDLPSMDFLESCASELSVHQSSELGRKAVQERTVAVESCSWLHLCREGLRDLRHRGQSKNARILLILPTESGYMVREDILRKRLLGQPDILSVQLRYEIGQTVEALPISQDIGQLGSVFNTAAAAVVMQANDPLICRPSILDELQVRLACQWVFKGNLIRRTVALIDGGFNYTFREGIFSAAASLGIDLVVFDKAGHWLQTYKGMTGPIAAFVAIDMTNDEDLPRRIADAMGQYPTSFDGVTTFTDSFLVVAAQVAQMCSLPTDPVEAFQTTVDKIRTRQLSPLPAPAEPSQSVIVKPSEGGGSRAVFLARNELEQSSAEDFIRGLGLVPVHEQYLDGPEVDINIALQDGKVLLAEVSDNLPTMAEGFPSQHRASAWLETGSVFPSGLPDEDTALICNYTSSCLLKAGFRSGIFHCEARIVGSAFAYGFDESPYPRLRQRKQNNVRRSPAVAIVEINARAPGHNSDIESMYASGVDFYALQFLAACGDHARFAALSQSYSKALGWYGGGFVGAEKGGKFAPHLMFEELKTQAPALMGHVVEWLVYFKPGEKIEDPAVAGKFVWVAWFLARSYISLEHLESVVEEVRSALKFDVCP